MEEKILTTIELFNKYDTNWKLTLNDFSYNFEADLIQWYL